MRKLAISGYDFLGSIQMSIMHIRNFNLNFTIRKLCTRAIRYEIENVALIISKSTDCCIEMRKTELLKLCNLGEKRAFISEIFAKFFKMSKFLKFERGLIKYKVEEYVLA